jgi:hypothetical protein
MLGWSKNFVRNWWNAGIAVGLITVVLALAIKNYDIAVIGVGVVGFGLAEQMLMSYSRFSRPLGFSLFGLGVILIVLALYHLFGL